MRTRRKKMDRLVWMSDVLNQLCLDHKDVVYIDKRECARRIEALPTVSIAEILELNEPQEDR